MLYEEWVVGRVATHYTTSTHLPHELERTARTQQADGHKHCSFQHQRLTHHQTFREPPDTLCILRFTINNSDRRVF